uniref:Uncharacterized protein n=1 Tax=Strigops habroptila TaxID=2489341 RepID=A0A672UKQ0_STRHB
MTNSTLKNKLPVESDSSLLIGLKPFSTENLTKNAVDDEETNERHIENLCRSSFLKISNEKNSIQETDAISEDCNTLLLSIENKLGSHQSTSEPDMEAKPLSLNGERKEILQCHNSNIHVNVPDNNTRDTPALKAKENSSNAWAFFPINFQLPTEELQLFSSEVTNSQPDILSSVKVVSEYSEDSSMLSSCRDNAQEAGDPEPAEASQLKDNQDGNTTCSFLGLPLSLGFAFQLVQLFGSPGLPLESLLPDDYVVPLDWKVSKMIYLLWKTSVEVRILGDFGKVVAEK